MTDEYRGSRGLSKRESLNSTKFGGDDVERLEKDDYVMSGSRHAKMNAERLKKENQVYTTYYCKKLEFVKRNM